MSGRHHPPPRCHRVSFARWRRRVGRERGLRRLMPRIGRSGAEDTVAMHRVGGSPLRGASERRRQPAPATTPRPSPNHHRPRLPRGCRAARVHGRPPEKPRPRPQLARPLQEAHSGWSLPVARALCLSGALAARLGRLPDSLDSLNAAAEILASPHIPASAEILASPHIPTSAAPSVAAAAHDQLARTKTASGRRWDTAADLWRALDLKTRYLDDQNSTELADAYRDAVEGYVGVLFFDRTLPLCLKALEICMMRFGEGSAEEAREKNTWAVRWDFGVTSCVDVLLSRNNAPTVALPTEFPWLVFMVEHYRFALDQQEM